MNNDSKTAGRMPSIFETPILEAFDSILDLTSTALVQGYPFPDEKLIEQGRYTALQALAVTIIIQIEALQETLRYYRDCLEAKPQEPPEDPRQLDEAAFIPF